MRRLELWGGLECTLNRVRDRWYSQLAWTGHEQRISDLELIAGLGIRTLRYPVLWEQCAPHSLAEVDWRWADQRLRRLQELHIQPVVGLIHHGSGPRYADIGSERFAPGLAEFAMRFAERFPWVDRYTPVNEPLTTARFSGLYGHWYPHGTDDRTFVRTLLNQCSAIRLAMQAIRTVNAGAQLVQTEDLGTTYAAGAAVSQAEFDNERRWLSWDLLCGRVDRHHPLRPFLLRSGASAEELDLLVHEPCAPSVIGINHYVTSDRYLDPRLEKYPPHTWGGNGRQRYADVEAVRVLEGSYCGWRVIDQAWSRYRLPLALTEVHIGCAQEEQLRWLLDAWLAAQQAHDSGSAVLAVTAWALLGGYDWDSLVTCPRGHYECGAFDARAPQPRPTPLAGLIRTLAGNEAALSPAVDGAGWWQLPHRQLYGRSGVNV